MGEWCHTKGGLRLCLPVLVQVSDLAALPAALQQQQPLSAQLLRGILRSAATAGGTCVGTCLPLQDTRRCYIMFQSDGSTSNCRISVTGLGSRAGRSLQTQFDQAVACLRAVHSQLVVVETALAATRADGDVCLVMDAPQVTRASCCSGTPLSQAVADKLAEWEALVASHQSASRILQWSVPLA